MSTVWVEGGYGVDRCWMDDVKVALGGRAVTVETTRQSAKDRKEWRAD